MAGFFEGMSRGLKIGLDSNTRFKQIEQLNAKTDQELAALGVKRNEITQYVFRDIYYL